jgi:hypothetical protein
MIDMPLSGRYQLKLSGSQPAKIFNFGMQACYVFQSQMLTETGRPS